MATVPNIIANLPGGNQPAALLDQNWAACLVAANNLSDVANPATALANLGGQAQSAVTPWTPNDASGASLSFTNVDAAYQTIGNFVYAYFSLTYPSTGNGANAVIGGLPVNIVNSNRGNVAAILQNSGATLTYGVGVKNTKTFGLWSGGSVRVNSGVSGLTISGLIIYPTT
jgi:hypothetical protein